MRSASCRRATSPGASGVLPQSPLAPEGLTVADLVARGRYPHQGLFRQWSRHDEAAVEEALAATGTGELRDRPVDELSGGQRQRAWIAMALAQQTELLLLDEPTTHLDLAHQVEVLDLLDGLVAERGRTVVMVLHDLNQACRYADTLVALRDGRVHAAGPPSDIVDAAFVQRGPRPRRPRHRRPRDGHPAVPPDRPAKENPMHLILRAAALLARPVAGRVRRRRRVELVSPPRRGSSSSAFPVTVEHKFGSTEIAAEPKRVVTVGYTDQDAVLAFGVVPVGVGDFLGGYKWRERPWAQDALGGAEPEVVSGQQINFEAVAAQRPDLIIAINAGLKQGDYDRLSQIAPTVGQSGDYIDFGMPWEEQTLLVGRALGHERLVVGLLRRVVVVPLRRGLAVPRGDQAVEVVLPAGADAARVGVVREVVGEHEGRDPVGLAELGLEQPCSARVVCLHHQPLRRLARLDAHLRGTRALLEAHRQLDGLTRRAVSRPGTEPARGALGLGDARPHVLDRCPERPLQDEVAALCGWQHAARRARRHADSFVIARSRRVR